MSRMNIERSREIRQWIGLGIKAISTGAMLDYWFNDGKVVNGAINKIREKVDTIKAKKAAKDQTNTVVSEGTFNNI